MNNLGNERWLNRTWTTSRSVPISLPNPILEKLDLLSSVPYKYMILDICTNAQGEYVGSYGTDELPAICEYG